MITWIPFNKCQHCGELLTIDHECKTFPPKVDNYGQWLISQFTKPFKLREVDECVVDANGIAMDGDEATFMIAIATGYPVRYWRLKNLREVVDALNKFKEGGT